MTTIENEHFNCSKMVSYKVMTIENQKGYRWHKEVLGAPRDVGGIGGVGVSGEYWGLAGSVGTQGPEGYR